MAAPAAPSTPSQAPVPDVLLSLAKDDRYISRITELLAQSIGPLASVFLEARDILHDDGLPFMERIRPELQLFASTMVHSAAFVYYTRQFGTNHNPRVARRSIGMESLNLAYSFGEVSSSPHVAMSPLIGRRVKHCYQRVLEFISVDRWQVLLFLQTVVPYLMDRAGRGGWSKDFGEIRNACLRSFGWNVVRHGGFRTNDDPSSVEDEDAFRNDDRLRGSARRRLFEAQRRRMMNTRPSPSRDEPTVDNNGPSIDWQSSNNNNNNRMVRTAQSVAEFSWEFLRRVSLALSSLTHGAHTLAGQGRTNTDTANLDRYTNILKWLLRLHLALFYWDGMYPTVYHRLVGARIRDGVPPSNPDVTLGPNAGVVVANRPTYKPIAVLILIQAMTALTQSTVEYSIEVVHTIQIAFLRWRRQRSRNQHPIVNHRVDAHEKSEREIYLDLVEEHVPSITSSKEEDHETKDSHIRRFKESKSNTHPCGVCLNERVHPAASSVCGHVFCWNCILHWVSNIRPECPLCRAQTRPQDVLPLINYH